jgi:hypothetical protein
MVTFPIEFPIHKAAATLRNIKTKKKENAINKITVADEMMLEALSDAFRTNNFHFASK